MSANNWGGDMLKIWARLFQLVQSNNRKSRKRKELEYPSISVDMSVQLKDITVRIIHAGGREESYQKEIYASELMEKYPRMCVARPQVFKHPHESVLLPPEKLFPGHKYYVIPSTTVQKLKRKVEKCRAKEIAKGKEGLTDGKVKGIEGVTDGTVVADVGDDFSEDSVCSAKDFYGSRETWTRCLLRKCRLGKPFVPPIQKPKMWRESGWEPSLNSIQEISP